MTRFKPNRSLLIPPLQLLIFRPVLAVVCFLCSCMSLAVTHVVTSGDTATGWKASGSIGPSGSTYFGQFSLTLKPWTWADGLKSFELAHGTLSRIVYSPTKVAFAGVGTQTVIKDSVYYEIECQLRVTFEDIPGGDVVSFQATNIPAQYNGIAKISGSFVSGNDIELFSNPSVTATNVTLNGSTLSWQVTSTGRTNSHLLETGVLATGEPLGQYSFSVEVSVVPGTPASVSVDLSRVAGFKKCGGHQTLLVSGNYRDDVPGVTVQSGLATYRAFAPVVLVPGILSTRWSVLEQYFDLASRQYLVARGELGRPYSTKNYGSSGDLSTFNFAMYGSLHEEAVRLRNHVNTVLARNPLFRRVFIVAHSKGGLVTRAYLQTNPFTGTSLSYSPLGGLFGGGGSSCKAAFLCQVPNLGSTVAYDWPVNPYRDLRPLYPYIGALGRVLGPAWQPALAGGGFDPNANLELAELNGLAPARNYGSFLSGLQGSVVELLFSRGFGTPFTRVYATSLPGSVVHSTVNAAGDGIVTAFSQLGIMVNPNFGENPNDLTRPAVGPLNGILRKEFAGHHAGFVELESARSYLVDRILNFL